MLRSKIVTFCSRNVLLLGTVATGIAVGTVGTAHYRVIERCKQTVEKNPLMYHQLPSYLKSKQEITDAYYHGPRSEFWSDKATKQSVEKFKRYVDTDPMLFYFLDDKYKTIELCEHVIHRNPEFLCCVPMAQRTMKMYEHCARTLYQKNYYDYSGNPIDNFRGTALDGKLFKHLFPSVILSTADTTVTDGLNMKHGYNDYKHSFKYLTAKQSMAVPNGYLINKNYVDKKYIILPDDARIFIDSNGNIISDRLIIPDEATMLADQGKKFDLLLAPV